MLIFFKSIYVYLNSTIFKTSQFQTLSEIFDFAFKTTILNVYFLIIGSFCQPEVGPNRSAKISHKKCQTASFVAFGVSTLHIDFELFNFILFKFKFQFKCLFLQMIKKSLNA